MGPHERAMREEIAQRSFGSQYELWEIEAARRQDRIDAFWRFFRRIFGGG